MKRQSIIKTSLGLFLIFCSTILFAQSKSIMTSSNNPNFKKDFSFSINQIRMTKQFFNTPILQQKDILTRPTFQMPSKIEHSGSYLKTRTYRSNIWGNKVYY